MIKKLMASLAVAVACTGPVFAQGIPVIDVASLTQAINQVLAWEQQYKQMLQQLQQMQQQSQKQLPS